MVYFAEMCCIYHSMWMFTGVWIYGKVYAGEAKQRKDKFDHSQMFFIVHRYAVRFHNRP